MVSSTNARHVTSRVTSADSLLAADIQPFSAIIKSECHLGWCVDPDEVL
jgi:hypothetical protein